MSKLTITIIENVSKVGDKTLLAFEVDRVIEGAANDEPFSFLPVLYYLMPDVTLEAIHMLQERAGGIWYGVRSGDRKKLMEELIAEVRQKLDADAEKFPLEL